jgi:DNA-nicking Smr family endonuclease
VAAAVQAAKENIRQPSDEEVFLSAMRGVERMDGDSGRQVESRPEPPPAALPEDDDQAARQLGDLVNGRVEFELEYSEEYMSGFVRGTDPKVVQKLKAGSYSLEAHLDLHGMNSEQAYDSLLFFLRETYLQGKRTVLLVTGRGTGSPGGQSVLKQAVQGWLTREPLRRVVLAFVTALPRDGGTGALYVLLRRKKKNEGKVRWEREVEFGE